MIIVDNINKLGESCLWNKYDEKFYWVDIVDKKIKSYDGNNFKEFSTEKMPCCITLIDQHKFNLALEDSIGVYDIRNNSYNKQVSLLDNNVRFNDGKLNNNNVLHIGTMDRNEKEYIGKIYKYKNNYLEIIKENIGISNGISFDSTNRMYYSDSLSGKLFYDSNMINQYNDIGPDGACVDTNDNYYSCLWGGSRIDVYCNQIVEQQIQLPVKYPTCCCYGGKDMNKLFITSASIIDNSNNNGKIIII